MKLIPKISSTTKSVLKFEAKLLLGVAILAFILYFGSQILIAKSAEVVTNAYTDQYFR